MKHLTILIIGFFSQMLHAQVTDNISLNKQVDSLNQVLYTFIRTKSSNESLVLYKKVDSLATILGKETAAYSRTQLYHGMLLRSTNKREEAERVLLEVKELQERVVGKEHPDYSITLHELGYLCYFKSDYKNALKYLKQAHYIQEVILGKKDKFYPETLYFLAFLLRITGDLDGAESLIQDHITYSKDTYGVTHHKYGVSLIELGRVYFDRVEYRNAELTYIKAIEIMKNAGEGTDGAYGVALNYLGEVYKNSGQFEKAEPIYLKALAYQEKVGAKPRQIALTYNNLALVYDNMGNFKEAERYGVASLRLYEQTIGTDSPNFTLSLSTLSLIYLHLDSLETAQQYALKSLEIRAKQVGKEHKDYASALLRIAAVYVKLGQLDDALQAELECKSILEKINHQEKPSYASTLMFLATLYQLKGEYESAKKCAFDAKQLYEKTLGTTSSYYLGTLRKLAEIHWLLGEKESTLSYLETASTLDRNLLQKATLHLSEQELSAYAEKFSDGLSAELSLACSDKQITSTCYNDVLFQKGFLLNNTNQFRKLVHQDSIASFKFETLKTIRQKLAVQYAIPLADRDSLKVVLLEQNANTLEKEITTEIGGYAESIQQINWTEIQQLLQPDEAALEFVHFAFANPNPTDSICYAALILRKDSPQPLFIQLFEEKQLIPLLKGAAGGSNFVKINALYQQPELYQLIWEPLASALQGINTIYTAPSGLLHRINLATISAPNSKTIGESRQLVVMGSTRQLKQLPTAIKTPIPNAYLAGGIRYQPDDSYLQIALRESGTRSSDNANRLPFTADTTQNRASDLRYLPATASEVQEIGQSLKNARFTVRTDTGFYATEESMRQIGSSEVSPTLIHIATHGFFFPDPVRNKKTGAEGSIFKISDHPMLRSGLLLAGAQQAWSGKSTPANREDGILTAYEISQMNLSNTELVVLSACETGLGDIAGNEGVYGLQRAFKIAGAKYLIMSLWKVNDQSTKVFMTTFYEAWLTQKLSIPEAFRQTQAKMRKKYPDPYDWAGFILIE